MAQREESVGAFTQRTAWARSLETPLRRFLRTETGSAAFLLAATVAALLWVNVDASSYGTVWQTHLSVRIGDSGVAMDLRHWVNSGLMTFFFFVVGLEARRELDVGELRQRRRVALPILAGLGGMAVPVGIYLAVNAGRASAHGWGTTMSTDTAFALGMLALVGPRFPDRLRAFMLTVVVIDDVVALIVIATVYSEHVAITAATRRRGDRRRDTRRRCGRRANRARLRRAGNCGLGGALQVGRRPDRDRPRHGALDLRVPCRRAQTSSVQRICSGSSASSPHPSSSALRASVFAPRSRRTSGLQQLYHPWTSYVIVPLFALANAGIAISGSFLSHAYTSPVTLGVLFGYVAGKPIGITGTAWLVTKLSRGRLRPPVGWASVAGAGAVAGIGFTVSLLIATHAFHGVQLEEAKLGVLTAALCASLLTWLVFRATAMLPRRLRIRALLGTSDAIVDLAEPVDPDGTTFAGPPRRR